MRVSSNSSKSLRVVPQQERSERRVTAFLDAAAALFAELGYEAVTMTAVAARSGSSIGALYNYFPDKETLSYTLALHHAHELEARWKPLMERAASLTVPEFADLFIDNILDLAREQPAFLVLITAPIRFRRDPAARKASRQVFANALLAQNPRLEKDRALLLVNISFQLVKGMMQLYAAADTKTKSLIVAEYRSILAAYLAGALSQNTPGTRSPR